LAAALGLERDDIGERPLWVKAGKEQLVVPLTSIEAVRRVAPQPQGLRQIRSEDGISMAYVFALTGAGTALARFFFPQGAASLEDPATGSATANFGGWVLAMQQPLPAALQSHRRIRGPLALPQVDDRQNIYVGGDVLWKRPGPSVSLAILVTRD
jgi:PhzF family phenazine biosynthesis protein